MYYKQYLNYQENTKTNKIQRQDIKDEICPICHEDLLESEALTYCSKMCGTNFHNACAKVWCMHKVSIL